MVQMMPLPARHICFMNIQYGLASWCQLSPILSWKKALNWYVIVLTLPVCGPNSFLNPEILPWWESPPWWEPMIIPAICYSVFVFVRLFVRNLSSVVSAISRLLRFICYQQQSGVFTCPFLIRFVFIRTWHFLYWFPNCLEWKFIDSYKHTHMYTDLAKPRLVICWLISDEWLVIIKGIGSPNA